MPIWHMKHDCFAPSNQESRRKKRFDKQAIDPLGLTKHFENYIFHSRKWHMVLCNFQHKHSSEGIRWHQCLKKPVDQFWNLTRRMCVTHLWHLGVFCCHDETLSMVLMLDASRFCLEEICALLRQHNGKRTMRYFPIASTARHQAVPLKYRPVRFGQHTLQVRMYLLRTKSIVLQLHEHRVNTEHCTCESCWW